MPKRTRYSRRSATKKADDEPDLDDLPDPDVPVELYDLDALPDPPPTWEFLGRQMSQVAAARDTKIATCDALAKIHLWGFDFATKRRAKKAELVRALWKLFYYQREECRAKTWSELFLITRDAGPRLLQYTLEPRPIPVSRFYPYEPSDTHLIDASYIRPIDAPDDMPDHVLNQFLLPVQNPHAHAVARSPETSFQSRKRRRVNSSSGVLDPALFPGPSSGPSPSEKPSSQPPISQYSLNSNPWVPIVPTYTPGYDAIPMVEAVQKAIFKSTYKDLERDPTAPSEAPIINKVARSAEDLQIVQIGVQRAHNMVKLNKFFEWDTEDDNLVLPYVGRGPVWANNSCSIDSIIVLGKLLDVGSTVIDRQHGRPHYWSKETKAFVEVVNVNWEALPDEVSCSIRDVFWKTLENTYPFVRDGITWLAFSTLTKEFAQFQYHGRDYTTTCACEGSITDSAPYSGNCVSHATTSMDYVGVNVPTLISRVWYGRQVYRCLKCGAAEGPVEERRIEQLPLRLVMNSMCSYDVKVENHTADFNIDYLDCEGNMQVARYRWVGGIYHCDRHARTYYRGTPRGEEDFGDVWMYDGATNSGVIVGGIPPYSAEEWLSPRWTENGMVIVVYERVLEPSLDDLAAASNAINEILACSAQNKSALSGITPWRRPVKPPKNEEARVLSVVADRYYETQRRDLPGPAEQDPDVTTAYDLAWLHGCDGLNTPPTMGGPSAPNNASGDNRSPLHFLQALEENFPSSGAPSINPRDPLQGIIDPSRLARPEMSTQDMQGRYPELFDEHKIVNPASLCIHRELWPNGSPSDGGATSWPVLPRTPPGASSRPTTPISPTKEFLNLSSPEGSPNGVRRSRRKKTRLGIVGGDVTGGADPDIEMRDAQSDGNTSDDLVQQFRTLSSHFGQPLQCEASSYQRAGPSPRLVNRVPIRRPMKVAKDSMRKRALHNAMAAKNTRELQQAAIRKQRTRSTSKEGSK